ncbi:MAG: SDR family oxidoreductase [Bacteroidales bacterium]|nr:SDR family oxidoreductase [Bacteroidales bacterium]
MNIIVTGASKGIGKELVKLFAQEKGNTIVAISRNKPLLDELKKDCETFSADSKVFPFPFDLGSGDMVDGLIPYMKKVMPSVDILVNNAGTLVNKPFENLTEEDFDQLFNVNVKSAFKLVQALLSFFPANSHIVNISSMGGYQGSMKFPGLSLYAASKGALAILTECMAEELKDREIKVNCLALGAVQTEMLSEAFPGFKAPLKPEQMAGFIKSFAVTGHHVFNGKILPVSLSIP